MRNFIRENMVYFVVGENNMSIIFSSRIRTMGSRVIGFVLAFIIAFSFGLWHYTFPLIEHLLWLLGWFLVGIGAMGRIWCSIYILGHKNAKLVMDGPYSICRNPLYFFSFLAALGIMFLTETLFFPVAFSVLFLVYYYFVIRQEERFLRKKFDQLYLNYTQTTPRFWPSFKNYSEPQYCQVSSKHFRLFLAQVIWFFWVAAFVQLFEELRLLGVFPIYFNMF